MTIKKDRSAGSVTGYGWRSTGLSQTDLASMAGISVDYLKLSVWFGMIITPWAMILVLYLAYFRS